MDAVVRCVEQESLTNLSLEAVAAAAGVGRATIYRHFPGGRDQLVAETITREVARFWRELATEVAHAASLEDRLVHGVMIANRRVAEYDLLQRLLSLEPEELLTALIASEPLVHTVVRDYLADLLRAEVLRDDVDVEDAADYLTRMLLSHIGTTGRWDMTDEAVVRRLVRTQFLAGIAAVGG